MGYGKFNVWSSRRQTREEAQQKMRCWRWRSSKNKRSLEPFSCKYTRPSFVCFLLCVSPECLPYSVCVWAGVIGIGLSNQSSFVDKIVLLVNNNNSNSFFIKWTTHLEGGGSPEGNPFTSIHPFTHYWGSCCCWTSDWNWMAGSQVNLPRRWNVKWGWGINQVVC